MSLTGLLLATAVLQASAPSTPPATGAHRLSDVVVAASPVHEGQAPTRFGDAVTSVGERQILDLNAQDLATALYRVPGVSMSRHNPVGAFGGGDGGAVFVRGHGSGRPGQEIGTLVDGVPRMSGVFSHSLLDALSIDVVERVDVYSSPQPVLFGGGSFAVVDLIPRQRRVPGGRGSVGLGLGAYGTLVTGAEYGEREGAEDWYLVSSHRASQGHRDDADGTVDALYARYGRQVGHGRAWSLQLHHTASSVGDPRALEAPVIPLVERFDVRADLMVGSLSWEGDRGRGHVKLYLDDGTQDWLQWDALVPEPFTSATDYRAYGLRARHTAVLPRATELVLGLDQDFAGGDYAEERLSGHRLVTSMLTRSTAPYAMLSRSFTVPGGSLTPSAGARYADTDEFGHATGWQYGLVLTRGATTLRGGLSRSFTFPGVYAAILFGGGPGGTAWQDLGPQWLDHLEFGVERQVSERLRLSLAWFDDEVRDALRLVAPPPQLLNVGDYESRGFELGLSLTASDRLEVYLGGTVSDTTPDDVPYQADRTLTGGVTWTPVRAWRISASLRHTTGYDTGNPRFGTTSTVDGASVVNLRVARTLRRPDGSDRGEAWLAVENATDRAYELKPGYPMPGSWVMAGWKLRF